MAKKDKNPLLFMRIIFCFAVASGVGAIGFYLSTFCTFKECYLLADIEKWGQTGDFFGGILNPFFTLFGLIFIIVTIQQNQKALKQNKKGLKESNDALISQVITAENQRFETTFFQLLSLFNGVVRDLKITITDERGCNTTEGREVLRLLYKDWRDRIKAIKTSDIEELKKEFYDSYEGYSLASYFYNLYSIIKFVDDSKLSDIDKKFYTNLVRAQLSEYELGLLFYIRLLPTKFECGKLSPLLKKYDLLEYLEDEVLADPSHRSILNGCD